MEQELEKISGTVEDVTYHNEESGFTVLLVDVDGDPVTVVGEVPEIAEGEEITATGNYKVHGTYGVQFRAELIERTLPATAGAIRKYLSSGAVKGLGPALAGRIVARFGDDTLTIIEKEPERLTEVRGISAEKARKIGEEYQRQFGIRSVMSLLASLGLPAATAIKAWRRWGSIPRAGGTTALIRGCPPKSRRRSATACTMPTSGCMMTIPKPMASAPVPLSAAP